MTSTSKYIYRFLFIRFRDVERENVGTQQTRKFLSRGVIKTLAHRPLSDVIWMLERTGEKVLSSGNMRKLKRKGGRGKEQLQ